MFGKDADQLAAVDYQRAAGVCFFHAAGDIDGRRVWLYTDRQLVIKPAQIVLHDRLRKTFRRIDTGNIELAKRRQTIFATVNAVNVFVATGRAVHKSEVKSQRSEIPGIL